MALARNLKPNRTFKRRGGSANPKNYRKIALYGFLLLVFLFGVYGVFNLIRLAPSEDDKQELVLDTGDRPLPEELKIWIEAPGGLNMRSEPNTNSKILKIIPDGTELVSLEMSGEWYKVSYDEKVGWVHRDFVRTFKEEIKENTNDNWKSYNNSVHNYTVSHPEDWVNKDYGSNEAANLLSYVGFGLQLADSLNPAVLPPIVIKITTDKKDAVDELYSKKSEVKSSSVTISQKKANQYIYIASSGVQMTAYIVSDGANTYILEESGGYADELEKMVRSFKFN